MILKETCPRITWGGGQIKSEIPCPHPHMSPPSVSSEKHCPVTWHHLGLVQSGLTTAEWAQYIWQRLRVLYQQLSYRTMRGMTGPTGGRSLWVTHSREAICRRRGLSWTSNAGKDLQWGNEHAKDYSPNGTLSKTGTLNKPPCHHRDPDCGPWLPGRGPGLWAHR